MKKLFVLISCIVFISLLTACQSSKKLSDTSAFETADETMSAFINALESKDSDLILNFFAIPVRPIVKKAYPKTYFPLWVKILKEFPPTRISEQKIDEKYVPFFTIRPHPTTRLIAPSVLALHGGKNNWHIVPFFETPEDTIEAFISALEANDKDLALSYFANRSFYEPIFEIADLQFLAQDLREYPPELVRGQDPTDSYLVYKAQRHMKGGLQLYTMNLIANDDYTWRISGF